MTAVKELCATGFAASVDLFGESVSDREASERVVSGYLEAAAALRSLHGDIYLEVVPSHLGIDISTDHFCRQAMRLVEVLPRGGRLEISAEESSRTDRTLQAALAMARQGAPIMPTLQANLRRSERDADRLIDAGVPVRLVKGAYLERPELALAWGEPTDLAFVQLAHRLRAGGVELAIGTHDPVIREALLISLPGILVEMLLGVRQEDAHDLVRRDVPVRIYVPYGPAWFRYWLRRMAEARGA